MKVCNNYCTTFFIFLHLLPSILVVNVEYLFVTFRGKDNVIAIHASLRCQDHTVLILPYFSHDKFTVSFEISCRLLH